MRCTLTCDGVPVGVADLAGGGLRAGRLAPLPGYEAAGLARAARRLGVALLVARGPRVPPAAGARALAAATADAAALVARLGLRDARGAAVAVVRLAGVELPRRSPLAGAYGVADLGEEGAGRGAVEPGAPAAGRDASRPAA